ncbi:Pyridoxamine 5'-phosphate oxidase [Mycobacterium sp. THAF192]|nr:Pyridoxamine 5'-phosphate oxidase [Mycobacterium sp. THAF192]
MTTAEIDAFLSEQRTCRVATVSGTGQPHVTPLWFAWDGTAIWLYSIVDSQRWTDLTRDARVALVIDDGEHYGELRGVEIVGTAAAIGDVPRSGSPRADVSIPERLFSEKYFGADEFVSDGLHAWLRVNPVHLRSWNFRKLRSGPT